jgi:hypothetical protein
MRAVSDAPKLPQSIRTGERHEVEAVLHLDAEKPAYIRKLAVYSPKSIFFIGLLDSVR